LLLLLLAELEQPVSAAAVAPRAKSAAPMADALRDLCTVIPL
jgi:hypothetical protein